MCPPETLKSMADPEISRRSLLRFGLGAAVAAAVGGVGAAEAAPVRPTRFSNVLDLTHVLGPDIPVFPSFPKFKIETFATFEGAGFYSNVITTVEHCGTHIDAPVHFDPKGIFVDQIPPAQLIAPAVVINIGERAARNPDTVVTPDDLRAWERRYGRIPNGAVVLMASGWGARAGSSERFLNADSGGTMHFPGFGKEAIDFLLTERSIYGIGVDTLSLDQGASSTFPVHFTLLPAGRWGLEFVANIESIPPNGATLFVGAPRTASGSGGQSRVFAVW
ncbi:MAG TPA: cyclase family protein [Roseiflexaceae bacterium]|nr:cyclase family protein [Roseiflexaceae bacterium]